MKTITLEEHFVTRGFVEAVRPYVGTGGPLAAVQDKLLDLGNGRVRAMDEAGVDVQVLSLASIGWDELLAGEQTRLAREINDELGAAVRANPTRFAGFATLGLKDVAGAVAEFERAVIELGFKGALVDGMTEGKFLDEPEFAPLWDTAARLGVPVYLHPAPPPKEVKEVYFSGLPGDLGMALSIAGWGWHAETGLHLLRLICSGLFERLPALQLIVGHMGEGVPYALARSSGILSPMTKLPHTVAEYLKRNVWITTSGYFTPEPLRCAREVVGADRLLYSVDYPFSPMTKGEGYLEVLRGEMDGAAMEAFRGGIAAKLLKL